MLKIMITNGNQHRFWTHGHKEITLGTLMSSTTLMKSSGMSKPKMRLEVHITNQIMAKQCTQVMENLLTHSTTRGSVFIKKQRMLKTTITSGSQHQFWTHGHKEIIPGTLMSLITQTKWSGTSKPSPKQVVHTTNLTMERLSTLVTESHPTPSTTKDSPSCKTVFANTITKTSKHQPSCLTTKWTMPGLVENSMLRMKWHGEMKQTMLMMVQHTTPTESGTKRWNAVVADPSGTATNVVKANAPVDNQPAPGVAPMVALVVQTMLIHGTIIIIKDGNEQKLQNP